MFVVVISKISNHLMLFGKSSNNQFIEILKSVVTFIFVKTFHTIVQGKRSFTEDKLNSY